ncbi:MAG: endonuclease/exonuclease/phosphatase family protein [Puniceicoccales bacterium]
MKIAVYSLIAPFFLGLFLHLSAREFTIVAFNVENLFDIDGIALYEDYGQLPREGGGIPYSAELLEKKLDFVTASLSAVNDGEGPEILMIQELERDQTPDSTIESVEAFLEEFQGKTLAEMLSDPIDARVRGLPSYAFLLKAMQERGLSYPYYALGADPEEVEGRAAHVNTVFSRFPIVRVRSYPTVLAREVLVLDLDVDGQLLTVINNHWKSGASHPETEQIRMQNAQTVRYVLEEILANDPQADVVIAGDLNSYYDQIRLYPEMKRTGINSVLGSQGDEQAVANGEEELYNLWFELPVDERFSEVWRGRKGTLMNMIITPGLYDDRGIRYLDNSFDVLQIPGVNADDWGRPIRFQFEGGGRGGSDHLPILARFETVDGSGEAILPLKNPGREEDQPGEILYLNYDLERYAGPAPVPMKDLLTLPRSEWGKFLGQLFIVEGRWVSRNPPTLLTGEEEMEVYCPDPSIWDQVGKLSPGKTVRFVGELGTWKGNYQWVIRDASWLR